MKPSKFHSNKDLSNWIVYNIGDKYLEKYSKYYNGVLVDLGCGEAPYKKYFLQYCKKYIGVDWTKTLHNSQADIESDLNNKINLSDNSADTIISLSVMEHLYEPQIFLNEAYRILKSNGTIILQVPWQWHVHEAPHDYFRYTPYGLKYLFNKAGFKDIKIEATSGFFTMWILKFNYFTSRFRYFKRSKISYYFVTILMLPIWTLGQIIAPLLDKLDHKWSDETQGYFVIAKK
jgi:SAM-dependent methyltransferase